MGIIYISILAFVIFGILAIVAIKLRDEICGVFIGLDFCLFIALLIMAYTSMTAEPRWAAFKYEYESTKEVISTYHPYDYGNTQDITKKIFKINETIARNKAYYDNKWLGVWYSEEIGNLEPLKFEKVVKEESLQQ